MAGVTAACPEMMGESDDEPRGAPAERQAGLDPYAPPRADATASAVGVGALAWVLTTYFAEGLPYSLVHQVIAQQYFTDAGLSYAALGLTALLHAPWNAKFLWAPLIDRWGNAKRWLIGAQLALAGALLAASVLAGAWAVQPMILLLVGMAFMAATNDIAIDTYYMRALAKPEQARFTGARVMAYRAALVAGNGGLVVLAGVAGWSVALGVGAVALFASAMLHRIYLAPDPPGEARGLPLRATVVSFFQRPGIALALAFIVLFKAGDALMFAMNAPLLRELGLQTAERGFYYGTLGTGASVAGSILGGVLAARGLERWLTPVAVVQSLAILLYAALAALRPSLPVIASVIVVEQLVAGVGSSVFVVFILRLCDGPHKATHFSFGTAIMSLAVTGAGTVSGFLLQRIGFTGFFLLAFAASLPGVLLAPLVSRDRGGPPQLA